MDEWASIIANVGFPIAITVYLLVKFEGILTKNTIAIQALTDVIRDLRGRKTT